MRIQRIGGHRLLVHGQIGRGVVLELVRSCQVRPPSLERLTSIARLGAFASKT